MPPLGRLRPSRGSCRGRRWCPLLISASNSAFSFRWNRRPSKRALVHGRSDLGDVLGSLQLQLLLDLGILHASRHAPPKSGARADEEKRTCMWSRGQHDDRSRRRVNNKKFETDLDFLVNAVDRAGLCRVAIEVIVLWLVAGITVLSRGALRRWGKFRRTCLGSSRLSH
jgi:hypothetical protein